MRKTSTSSVSEKQHCFIVSETLEISCCRNHMNYNIKHTFMLTFYAFLTKNVTCIMFYVNPEQSLYYEISLFSIFKLSSTQISYH